MTDRYTGRIHKQEMLYDNSHRGGHNAVAGQGIPGFLGRKKGGLYSRAFSKSMLLPHLHFRVCLPEPRENK